MKKQTTLVEDIFSAAKYVSSLFADTMEGMKETWTEEGWQSIDRLYELIEQYQKENSNDVQD